MLQPQYYTEKIAEIHCPPIHLYQVKQLKMVHLLPESEVQNQGLGSNPVDPVLQVILSIVEDTIALPEIIGNLRLFIDTPV